MGIRKKITLLPSNTGISASILALAPLFLIKYIKNEI